MFLDYPKKLNRRDILNSKCEVSYEPKKLSCKNILIHGDNFNALKVLLDDFDFKNKVDLIYIDPPFSSNNVFRTGEKNNAISSRQEDDVAYRDILKGEKYLEFLRERLILLYEILSDKGSIYVHIDYKIGHYIKIILDEIFGIENFRNDITRIKCNPKNFKRKSYGNVKDMLLFYSKTDNFTWNHPTVPYTEDDIKRLYKKIDEKGRRYTTVPIHAPGETKDGITGQKWRGMYPPKGRHWRSSPDELDRLDKLGLIEWSANGNPRKKNYADEMKKKGKPMQDIWEYKDPSYPEYPTQKNIDMLEQIISASSNPNDLVLDCFAGSGTSLAASQKLGRRWIGIDESDKAIKTIIKRLKETNSNIWNNRKYDFIKIR